MTIRVHFATEDELIKAWYSEQSLPELARKWNVHYETIRYRWNLLKREGKIPNCTRRSASNLAGRLEKGREKVAAYNRLQRQMAEEGGEDERSGVVGSAGLVAALIEHHGPAPRVDLPKELLIPINKAFVRKLRVIHPEGDPHIEAPVQEMRT